MKKICVMLILALMIMGNAFAIESMDYLLVYRHSFIQNGKTDSLISKIYCQGNTKFRVESENSFTGQTNGVETSGKSLSVSIIRLDKKVNWLLDLENKICREQPITSQNLNKDPNLSFQNWKNKLTKIGEDKILDYNCEVYVSSGNNPLKYWVSKDHNLTLKIESGIEGNKSICEAIELRFEKQDDSLFEIPQDYKLIKLKVTTQDELDKQPPVTLSDIEKSLFKDMVVLKLISSKYGQYRDLTNDEVKIVRNSIIFGSDLGEATDEEVSEVQKKDENPIFILEWPEKQMCNFYYDKSSGFLYIDKGDVHREWEEHIMDSRWLKKYAEGTYKLKPSKEFDEILK